MMPWNSLVRMPDVDLARIDLALINLVCAEGLPGAEQLDAGFCLGALDRWAEMVRWETVKEMRQFDRAPGHFHNSRNFFRALTLVTVLQEDCGVRYNPAKISPDVPFEA